MATVRLILQRKRKGEDSSDENLTEFKTYDICNNDLILLIDRGGYEVVGNEVFRGDGRGGTCG